MTARDPDQDEEVVADGRQAEYAADAWLLAQCMHDRVKVLRGRHGESLGLPRTVLHVDGYGEITARHLCHRHFTVQLGRRHSGREGRPLGSRLAAARTVTAFGTESAWIGGPMILLGLRLHKRLAAIGLQWVLGYAEASEHYGCSSCGREVSDVEEGLHLGSCSLRDLLPRDQPSRRSPFR